MIVSKKFLSLKKFALPILISTSLITACGDDDDDSDADSNQNDTPTLNIVELAQSNENLTTLVAAVTAANLGETLATTQNLTVFAPTNDAFDALPEGAVKDIVAKVAAGEELSESETTALTEVLLYHVVGSRAIASTAVSNESAVASLNSDENLYFTVSQDNGIKVNASVSVNSELKDLAASNGIVHVVDSVLIPNKYGNLVDALAKRYDYTTLVAAVTAAELGTLLATTDNLTLFAPTNDAFAAIEVTAVSDIVAKVAAGDALDTAEKNALISVLGHHVIAGASSIAAADVPNGTAEAYNEQDLTLNTASGVTVKGANASSPTADVIEADIGTSNAIIHGIDAVLIPTL